MKYRGKVLGERNSDVLVLLRGSERIVFKAQAVESEESFHNLVSMPEPPEILRPGGVKEKNVSDSKYKEALASYVEQKTSWLVINSLKVTEELEWEKVDFNKPSTWVEWQSELREAGFTEIECSRIVQLVSQVNSLDDDMLDQARQDFLLEASQVKK